MKKKQGVGMVFLFSSSAGYFFAKSDKDILDNFLSIVKATKSDSTRYQDFPQTCSVILFQL